MGWWIVAPFVVAVLVVIVVLYRDLREARVDGEKAAKQAWRRLVRLEELDGRLKDKVVLKIADWGPDFTGEGDVLARFRWSISHLTLMGGEGEMEPMLMIGNSPTYRQAVFDAYAWIEQNRTPMHVITGVEPEVEEDRPPTADHPLVDGMNS